MILNERYKAPIISFGKAQLEATVILGNTITIFQNEIFSSEKVLEFQGFEKSSLYQIEYTPTTVGVEFLIVEVTNQAKTIVVESNRIRLNVILTVDNNTITSDTNLITADNG
jgi:hypothetical protein